MRNNELIQALHDLEYVFREGAGHRVSPDVVAEAFAMARHALELQPIGQARASDPSTSRKAVQSAAIRAGSQRYRLLKKYALHGANGLTDEQAGALAELNTPGTCYWKRCSELREFGYIEPLGLTRLASTGEQQMVCAITVAGRQIIEGLAVA